MMNTQVTLNMQETNDDISLVCLATDLDNNLQSTLAEQTVGVQTLLGLCYNTDMAQPPFVLTDMQF